MMTRVMDGSGELIPVWWDVGCGLERIGSCWYGSERHSMEMEGIGIDSARQSMGCC